jgi:hypothetical protein
MLFESTAAGNTVGRRMAEASNFVQMKQLLLSRARTSPSSRGSVCSRRTTFEEALLMAPPQLMRAVSAASTGSDFGLELDEADNHDENCEAMEVTVVIDAENGGVGLCDVPPLTRSISAPAN